MISRFFSINRLSARVLCLTLAACQGLEACGLSNDAQFAFQTNAISQTQALANRALYNIRAKTAPKQPLHTSLMALRSFEQGTHDEFEFPLSAFAQTVAVGIFLGIAGISTLWIMPYVKSHPSYIVHGIEICTAGLFAAAKGRNRSRKPNSATPRSRTDPITALEIENALRIHGGNVYASASYLRSVHPDFSQWLANRKITMETHLQHRLEINEDLSKLHKQLVREGYEQAIRDHGGHLAKIARALGVHKGTAKREIDSDLNLALLFRFFRAFQHELVADKPTPHLAQAGEQNLSESIAKEPRESPDAAPAILDVPLAGPKERITLHPLWALFLFQNDIELADYRQSPLGPEILMAVHEGAIPELANSFEFETLWNAAETILICAQNRLALQGDRASRRLTPADRFRQRLTEASFALFCELKPKDRNDVAALLRGERRYSRFRNAATKRQFIALRLGAPNRKTKTTPSTLHEVALYKRGEEGRKILPAPLPIVQDLSILSGTAVAAIRLLAKGIPEDAIVEELRLSRKTIRNELSKASDLLCLPNGSKVRRDALVRFAYANGLMDAELELKQVAITLWTLYESDEIIRRIMGAALVAHHNVNPKDKRRTLLKVRTVDNEKYGNWPAFVRQWRIVSARVVEKALPFPQTSERLTDMSIWVAACIMARGSPERYVDEVAALKTPQTPRPQGTVTTWDEIATQQVTYQNQTQRKILPFYARGFTEAMLGTQFRYRPSTINNTINRFGDENRAFPWRLRRADITRRLFASGAMDDFVNEYEDKIRRHYSGTPELVGIMEDALSVARALNSQNSLMDQIRAAYRARHGKLWGLRTGLRLLDQRFSKLFGLLKPHPLVALWVATVAMERQTRRKTQDSSLARAA